MRVRHRLPWWTPRRVHLLSALLWVALIPPTLLWWTRSVPFLVFASLWANVATHWSGMLAARAEEAAEDAGNDA